MAERDLRRKLFSLIAIRVAISALLLGSAVFVQLTSPRVSPGEPLFILIGITFALNVLWLLTLGWAERFRWMVDIQLACDTLIVSGFILVTGGINSYFAALFVLPIAGASSLQYRRGGMMIAMLSAVLYVGIVLTQILRVACDAWSHRSRACGSAAGRPDWRLHDRSQRLSFLLDCDPQRVAGRSAAARGCPARTRVDADRRPAGLQSARDRQSRERVGDHRSSGADPHLQPCGRSHYGTCRGIDRRPADRGRLGAAAHCRQRARGRGGLRLRPAHGELLPHGRRTRDRTGIHGHAIADSEWQRWKALRVPGRHRHQEARARRPHAAAPGGRRRDGCRHRARDSQPAAPPWRVPFRSFVRSSR